MTSGCSELSVQKGIRQLEDNKQLEDTSKIKILRQSVLRQDMKSWGQMSAYLKKL